MKSQKSKILIRILAILLVLSMITSGVYVYSKLLGGKDNNPKDNDTNENNNDQDNDKDNEKDNDGEEPGEDYNDDEIGLAENYTFYNAKEIKDVIYKDNAIEELDISSKQVKDLYQLVTLPNNDVHNDFHRSTVFANNTLDDNYKFYLTFLQFVYEDEDYNDYCDMDGLSISIDTFKNKYKEIFGTVYTKTDFTYENMPDVDATEDSYIFSEQGCAGFGAPTAYKIIKAKQTDDAIYIYDNYLYHVDPEGGGEAVCADSECKVVVLLNTDQFSDEYKTEVERLYLMDALIGYYPDFSGKQLPTYKHTFKKDSEGNYYWFSTEAINF